MKVLGSMTAPLRSLGHRRRAAAWLLGACCAMLPSAVAAQPEPPPPQPEPPLGAPEAGPADPYQRDLPTDEERSAEPPSDGDEAQPATGDPPAEPDDVDIPLYEVRRLDPWSDPRPPGRKRGSAYEHSESLEPWPATAGERRRSQHEDKRRGDVAAGTTAERALVGYDHGFFLSTPDGRYRLNINSRFEARYTYHDLGNGDLRSAFSVPRARLCLNGHVFEPELAYRVQTGFGGGEVTLKDAFLDYAFVPDQLHLRAGQFKRPLSRQQINSSTSFQFLERAITAGRLGAARDIGLLFHDNYESSPTVEYAIGMFNGTGDVSRLAGSVVVDALTHRGVIVDGGFSNVPEQFQPELTARVAYNYGDIDGYTEVDFKGGPLRFSVGGSVLTAFGGYGTDNPAEPGSGSVLHNLDTIVKLHGLTATAGAFLLYAQDGPSFTDQAYSALGFHLQAGYLIFRRAQLAARYARVHNREAGSTHETGGALSLYFIRTNLAWRTDALTVMEDYPPAYRGQFLVRTQLQLGF